MIKQPKTFHSKPADTKRTWYVVDAATQPLGRLAVSVANLLIGKHKPEYSPHVDGGDYVVVVNAQGLVTTGRKDEQKMYYKHSGYVGSIKQRTLAEQKQRDASKVIYEAVRGMLPKNKLQAGRLERLKVYNGSEHNHAAQKPVEIGAKNV